MPLARSSACHRPSSYRSAGGAIPLWIQLLYKIFRSGRARYPYIVDSSSRSRCDIDVQAEFKMSFEVRLALECLHSALTEGYLCLSSRGLGIFLQKVE